MLLQGREVLALGSVACGFLHSGNNILHGSGVADHEAVDGGAEVLRKLLGLGNGVGHRFLGDRKQHVIGSLQATLCIGIGLLIGSFVLGLHPDDLLEGVEALVVFTALCFLHHQGEFLQNGVELLAALAPVGLVLQEHGLGDLVSDPHDRVEA